MYAFKCGDDSRNKMKDFVNLNRKILKLKNKCLDGGENQKEPDNSTIRSLNHEMFLQRVLRSTLPPFNDKRCYESNI